MKKKSVSKLAEEAVDRLEKFGDSWFQFSQILDSIRSKYKSNEFIYGSVSSFGFISCLLDDFCGHNAAMKQDIVEAIGIKIVRSALTLSNITFSVDKHDSSIVQVSFMLDSSVPLSMVRESLIVEQPGSKSASASLISSAYDGSSQTSIINAFQKPAQSQSSSSNTMDIDDSIIPKIKCEGKYSNGDDLFIPILGK